MKTLLSLIGALSLILSAQAQQASVVSGVIVGRGGRPADAAQVSLYPASSREVLQSAAVRSDGTYRLKIDTTGLFIVQVAGASLPRQWVPLLIGRPGRQVKINVQIANPRPVAFEDKQSVAARYARFSRELSTRKKAFVNKLAALEKQNAREEIRRFRQGYDWSPNQALLEAMLVEAEVPIFRAALFVTYLSGTLDVDPAYARQALKEIDPTSPLWAARPLALRSALRATGQPDAYDAYVTKVLSTHTSVELNASLLLDRLFRAPDHGADGEVGALYERLVTEYPNTLYAKIARLRFNPSHAIRKGAPVPPFEVAALDEPGVTYSREHLKGRVYLIDFWATWCGPCLAEMSVLHEAYQAYHDEGFTILSLSFDRAPEVVRTYRQDEWAMPWLHAFAKEGVDGKIARTFEVVSIPKPILVDANGTIIATGPRLRGPDLKQTLARLFEDKAATAKAERDE